MRAIAIILIALGVLGFLYQGFTYWTRDTVAQAGPVAVTADRAHTVWIPPVVAGVAILAGAVILAAAGPRD
jgi:hypothetical protein